MRIISGTTRGTKLDTPIGEETRPTLARVKENFFNAIHFDIEGAKVLDLFAGSGQLGLEALSRGARACVFVDSDAECVEIITKNAQRAKLYDKCNIYRAEFGEYLSSVAKRRGFAEKFEKFDIVFLDPPYGQDKDSGRFIKEAVKRLIKHGFVADGGMIICESEAPFEIDEESAKCITDTRVYKYGRVLITILNIGNSNKESDGE